MQVLINGETKDIPSAATVQDLIQLLELKNDRVAVELNREIVKQRDWESTSVEAGAQVEIVHFVGGG